MFRRLVFENHAALFTIAAFAVAVAFYVTFFWRALRMKRPQVAHFENLPFGTPTPASRVGAGRWSPKSPAGSVRVCSSQPDEDIGRHQRR